MRDSLIGAKPPQVIRDCTTSPWRSAAAPCATFCLHVYRPFFAWMLMRSRRWPVGFYDPGLKLGMPRTLMTTLGAVVCFALRIVSVR